MEEQKIIEKLKEDTQEDNNDQQEREQKPAENPVSPNEGEINPLDKLKLLDYFGIDLQDANQDDVNDKLADIVSWALIQKPTADVFDTLWMIKTTEERLLKRDGPHLDNVWRYITLDNEMVKIQQKKRILER